MEASKKGHYEKAKEFVFIEGEAQKLLRAATATMAMRS